LKESKGTSNGTMNQRKYFECDDNYGVFVQAKDISRVIEKYKASHRFTIDDHAKVVETVNNKEITFEVVIKYIGLTEFENGVWFGIECENNNNNNNINSKYNHHNGIYDNTPYFQTQNNAKNGAFVREKQLSKLPANDKSNANNNNNNRAKRALSIEEQQSQKSENQNKVNSPTNKPKMAPKNQIEKLSLQVDDNNNNNDDDNKNNKNNKNKNQSKTPTPQKKNHKMTLDPSNESISRQRKNLIAKNNDTQNEKKLQEY